MSIEIYNKRRKKNKINSLKETGGAHARVSVRDREGKREKEREKKKELNKHVEERGGGHMHACVCV